MPRKAFLSFTILTAVACVLSYKLGSTPVALAKGQPAQQEGAPPPLPTAPPNWSLWTAGLNTKVSVSRPAGGTGVKHVATCISATSYINTSGTSGTVFGLILRDGPSGTGTVLFESVLAAPPGTAGQLALCDLNIVGSPNTAMTLEFAGWAANLGQYVTLVGYDAQ